MRNEWQPIETAPKDGTWIILEGEFEGGDTSCLRVGFWDNSDSQYPWQVVDSGICRYFSRVGAYEVFNLYAEGRVYNWMPLPETPKNQGGEDA